MIIQCEICEERIASATKIMLGLPIMSYMFAPVGPGHDHPWPEPVSWEFMACPVCGYRPFILTEEQVQRWVERRGPGPDRVKTTKGFYTVYSPLEPGETPTRIYEPEESDAELELQWNERLIPPQPAEMRDIRDSVKARVAQVGALQDEFDKADELDSKVLDGVEDAIISGTGLFKKGGRKRRVAAQETRQEG